CRCTHAGTPTGSEPAAFGTATVANIGDTITDTGGVTWQVESIPNDYLNAHAYVVGERVFSKANNQYVFERVVAGTSLASGEPSAFGAVGYLRAFLDDPSKPSGLQWKCLIPSG